MKPAAFVHHAPRSVEEAVAVLGHVGHDGKVLAGGQSLIPILNMRLASPGHLIDINRIDGLSDITVQGGWVRVEALVRQRALERSEAARLAQPVLRQALRNVAHPAIRNRGTTVGSIVHADAAGELPAILALTDGVVETVGPRGAREVPWEEFFRGALETSCGPDELAVAVRFGCFVEGTGTAFLESARRSGDYALAGVGVAVTLTDGTVSGARASFVSVTDVPSVVDLEAVLGGVEPGSGAWDAALDSVVEAVRGHVEPESDIHATSEYRRILVAELTRRALAEAARSAHSTRAGRPAPSSSVQKVPTPRAGSAHSTGARAAGSAHSTGGAEEVTVTVVVNGVTHTATVPARRLLSDFLRHDLKLTGTHVGCEHGVCGACTVLVDGEPARSCLMFAVSAQDHAITTIEGLGTEESMSPVQQAFIECHGLQCGFCTPGFVTTVTAYLDEHPSPTAAEARDAISGNLCRCTGYQNIVKSVLRAAELREERKVPYAAEPAQRHTTSSVVAEEGSA
ncbi:FAD binding domain-containing protein [Intrasporangium calvum]|uniref:(2Fe-2S)-binding domain-containing protein n=1 Tax=Intrasporangium calvum (strain ATCC 23552 / DSM 43043 / JCM 3097 / NBRC 12989 / NCIMB 10167 / NRRL B-3866 / 7 KIP) TaxID=710696 RepID=E6SDZ2_INTC7|nr:(2Fe-2S)-binding domain-containing protein [Intrasporangium calvum DSM 43043]